MVFDVDFGHLCVGDLDALGIEVSVDVAADGEARIGLGRGNELKDDHMADERFAAPVLGDEGEEAVLDFIPLAGAGWQMSGGDGEAGFVREALQFAFPEADPGAVAAAAVGGDVEAFGRGIADLSQQLPPAADALDRKGGRVGIDADIDPALVGRDIVDAVGRHLAQASSSKSWTRTGSGSPLRCRSRPAFLKLPTSSFFGVDGDYRFAFGARRLHGRVDVLELGVAIGMVGALPSLAVGLTTVVQITQQSSDQLLADLEALVAQRLDNVSLAAADPAQHGCRIAADRILYQSLERSQQARLNLLRAGTPPAGPPDAATGVRATD